MDYLAKLLRGKPLRFTGCCNEHDLFYEQGGSSKDRKFADKVLFQCVLTRLIKDKRPKHPAYIIYVAVRIFGKLYWRK